MRSNIFRLAVAGSISLVLLVACDKRRPSANASNTAARSPAPAAEGTKGGEDQGIVQGTINGGGGKGILCSRNGQETLEILDLHEAEDYGLKRLPNPATEEEAYDLAVEKLAVHLWNPSTIALPKFKKLLKKEMQKKLLGNFHFLKKGKKLRNINDANEVTAKEGCKPVQVAVYYESYLLIDKRLWAMLDNLNKAALWIHELVYSVERQYGRTDSGSTRILVGQMFSTKGARPKTDGVPADPAKHLTCRVLEDGTDVGYFYAHETKRDDEEGTEFVFNYLKTSNSLLRTAVFFDRLRLIQLEARKSQQDFTSQLAVDSLAEDRVVKLTLNGEVMALALIDLKREKTSAFQVSCDRRQGYMDPDPGRVERSPVNPLPINPAPPSIPDRVQLKSRYDGHGDYESTATYSFRFMTHDVKVSRNNWDILFEARSGLAKDYFTVNTVTDDDSFIYDLKVGCEKADPCEIFRNQLDAKSRTGKESSPYPDNHRRADLEKGHCYQVVSQDSDGSIAAMFEVSEHENGVSAVIDHIKILPLAPNRPDACEVVETGK